MKRVKVALTTENLSLSKFLTLQSFVRRALIALNQTSDGILLFIMMYRESARQLVFEFETSEADSSS